MGFWILEPKSDERVPGTVVVQSETDAQRVATRHLKHGGKGEEDLVLVPQPSDSVNDPLNWSRSAKLFHSWFLSAGTGLVSGCGLFLNPSNARMSKEIGTSITMLSRSTAVLLLFLGIGSVLSAPLARIYGKRPVLLFLNLVAVIGYAMIVARPKSVPVIFVGRAFYGAGISGLEYIVSSSVGDLFFVHQRGFHLALWHFALSGGNSIGQVIASQVVQGQSYIWAFRYALIFLGIYLILSYFLIPETSYIRPKIFDNDVHEHLAEDSESTVSESDKQQANVEAKEAGQILSEEKKTSYWSSLKLYNGRFSDESYLVSLAAPFATYLLPAVSWTAYAYGCSVAFAGAFSVSLAQIFSRPPYNFQPSSIGLMVLSAFIGTVLGNAIPGALADWLVKSMSRKNNGVYEPEYRLILSIPALILGLAGFWGFGLSIDAQNHWMVPVFFFGLATFSGSILSLISNTYLLDCHRKYATDAYAAVTLVKGVMAFTIPFFINDWITKNGVVQVFFIVGLIHGIAAIWGIVLYVYGKRLRLWVHKSAFLQAHLRETAQ